MKKIIAISILFAFFVNCKKKKEENKFVESNGTENLVKKFENELNGLNNADISLIDDATELFQKYISKISNKKQRDSLFQPYFNVYMSGRDFLINEENQLIEKYGFIKKYKNGKEYLNPSRSEFLQTNIIDHLSETMQKFCNQQLKEFNDIENLETIGNNTLWWEKFNKENSSFFLKEMTTYHYKNWHLKNLLSGTEEVLVFTKENSITENALEVYDDILKKNPETKTSKTLRTYLDLLKTHNMIRTDEVNEFINDLK